MGIVRRSAFILIPLAYLACSVSMASAQRVDWERGLLIATGAASGDLRSPNREMARIKAERQARRRCKARLLAAASGVAKAAGGDFSKQSEMIDSASMLSLHTDFGTDGSVVVTMAFGLDRLRAAAFGADKLVKGQAEEGKAKTSSSPILIDARGLALQPALGYQLSDGKRQYRGPTLFFRSEKAALARVGKEKGLEMVAATNLRKGELRIPNNALQDRLEELPLVVILWKEKK